jgi:hypothetical protein
MHKRKYQRVLAYARSQKIIITQPVSHSLHMAQPLDLSVFGLFKTLYKWGQKIKKMKGETLKIYRALLEFYRSIMIPMVRSSFIWAEFRLDPRNLSDSFIVVPSEVLDRIRMPEMTLENYVFREPTEATVAPDRDRRRRLRFPDQLNSPSV